MALITNCHHRHEQHQHQKQHHSHQHEHPHHRENLLYSSPHERVRQARGQIVSSLGSSPQILKVSTDEAKVRPGLSELQLSVEKIRRGGEASASPREETPSFACCCSAIALRGKIIHCRSRINRASSNYVSPYTTVMVTLLISLFVCNLVNLSSSDSPSNSFEQQQYLHQQQNSPSGVHFDGKNVKSSSSKSSQQQQTSDSFVRRTLSPRTVKIKYGSLRGSLIALGTFSPGQNVKVKGYIEVFQGIPYATPPIASLRFMPPVTPAYWKGTKLCTKFAPVCPQILPRLVLRFNSTSSSSSTLTNSNNNSGNNNSNNNFNTSDCLSFLLKFTSINSVKGAKNQSKNKQNTSSNFKPSNDVNSSKTESNVATLCHRQLLLERISSYLNEQSEDCLYLNLFLPYPTSALNGSSKWKTFSPLKLIECYKLLLTKLPAPPIIYFFYLYISLCISFCRLGLWLSLVICTRLPLQLLLLLLLLFWAICTKLILSLPLSSPWCNFSFFPSLRIWLLLLFRFVRYYFIGSGHWLPFNPFLLPSLASVTAWLFLIFFPLLGPLSLLDSGSCCALSSRPLILSLYRPSLFGREILFCPFSPCFSFRFTWINEPSELQVGFGRYKNKGHRHTAGWRERERERERGEKEEELGERKKM